MKISFNWLKELVPLTVTPEELSRHLLKIGFEVESSVARGAGFTGVVVGKVVKVGKHPNADRLRLCEVYDGKENFSVVCGAPNVAEGQFVPFARVGARLPGNFRIKRSKIRGALSDGMICSTKELALPENGVQTDGILILPEDSVIGSDFGESLGEPDVLLDVEITPNRPDCLSHSGLARELAVHFNLAPTLPKTEALGVPKDGPPPPPIEIAGPAECVRYRGQIIADIRVGPSPDWLAARLQALGLPSINNVVDITNLVLQETGQPLHAFDADKLEGGRIIVRDARAGEKILALNGRTYTLAPENLIIADANDPVAIAGVIGGQKSSVTANTTRILLECAHFKPARVRRSAKLLNLRTDSSYRFERGTDIAGVPLSAARAVGLILQLCGGRAGLAADTLPNPPAPRGIRLRPGRINEILGSDYPEERITTVLEALSDHMQREREELTVFPPSYRHDLETPWDLAEETARHLGYGAIPFSTAPVRMPHPMVLPLQEKIDSLRVMLVGLGYMEAYNYDFLSEDELRRHYGEDAAPRDRPKLLNPISKDWQYLRPALLPSLLRNAGLNFNRGAAGLRLFEVGRVYSKNETGVSERTHIAGLLAGPSQTAPHWASPQTGLDFYEVKAVVTELFFKRGVTWKRPEDTDGVYHPRASLDILQGNKRLGRFGLLHPNLLRAWDLEGKAVAAFELEVDGLLDAPHAPPQLDAAGVGKALSCEIPIAQTKRFAPFSVYPSSTRDLSVFVPAEVHWDGVSAALDALGIPELTRIDLIETFTDKEKFVPGGKISLTIRFTFSREDRTLREEEIRRNMETLTAAAVKEFSAELRA